MSRACGHHDLNKFGLEDLSTWHREMALLSGVHFSGMLAQGQTSPGDNSPE